MRLAVHDCLETTWWPLENSPVSVCGGKQRHKITCTLTGMLKSIRFVISVPSSTSVNNVSLDECLFYET
jgi:hypothetical protein